jgi:phosphoserine phosphatase
VILLSTENKTLINSIDDLGIKNIIFDFDGTMHPKLFLADASKTFFKNSGEFSHLNKLLKLSKNKKSSFEEILIEYINIMKGISASSFDDFCLKHPIDYYPSLKCTIKKFKSLGLKIFLSSLTSKAIAERVKNELNLDGCTYFPYPINYFQKNKKFAQLENGINVSNLAKFKLDSCIEQGWIGASPIIMVGDSSQDDELFNFSSISIGINPTSSFPFNYIFRDLKDPWKKLINLI